MPMTGSIVPFIEVCVDYQEVTVPDEPEAGQRRAFAHSNESFLGWCHQTLLASVLIHPGTVRR